MAVKIALAGNPNSGKQHFLTPDGFQSICGQLAGGYGRKEGRQAEGSEGRYDHRSAGDLFLSPYTLEEVVARNYLIHERPEAILNIVDGTNLERNLYLTTQLLELGIPVVVAVNMIDVVNKTAIRSTRSSSPRRWAARSSRFRH